MGPLTGLIILAAVHHALAAADYSTCGSPMVSRIVGGTDALDGEWPWQISLQYNGYHFCGGSLIAPQWVLCAAHCFQAYPSSSMVVYLGLYRLYTNSSHTFSTTIQRVITSGTFQTTGDPGDIALVQLASPVTYTQYIMPICLPSSSSVTFPCGMECWVTGWGATSEGGGPPLNGTLQMVMTPLIDYKTCGNMYHLLSSSNVIQSEKICAGYSNGGKDSCQGDSGGPLVCKVQSVWYQVGVVSWGDGCAGPNAPGVYTLVSAYQDWISNYTKVTFNNVTSIPPPTRTCGGSDNSNSGGNVTAGATASSGGGDVSFGTTVGSGGNISSGTTVGTGGNISAGTTVGSGGNISAGTTVGGGSGGSISSGTTVGSISGGNISAGTTVGSTSGGNISVRTTVGSSGGNTSVGTTVRNSGGNVGSIRGSSCYWMNLVLAALCWRICNP